LNNGDRDAGIQGIGRVVAYRRLLPLSLDVVRAIDEAEKPQVI
jgi:hypothetical protein